MGDYMDDDSLSPRTKWVIIFAILAIIILFLTCCNGFYRDSQMFEYEDLDGNTATSYHCQYSDKTFYSGGQGQPLCFVGKKIVAVKWFEDKTKYTNFWGLFME